MRTHALIHDFNQVTFNKNWVSHLLLPKINHQQLFDCTHVHIQEVVLTSVKHANLIPIRLGVRHFFGDDKTPDCLQSAVHKSKYIRKLFPGGPVLVRMIHVVDMLRPGDKVMPSPKRQ